MLYSHVDPWIDLGVTLVTNLLLILAVLRILHVCSSNVRVLTSIAFMFCIVPIHIFSESGTDCDTHAFSAIEYFVKLSPGFIKTL